MVCVPDELVSQQLITKFPQGEDECKGFLVTGVPVQFISLSAFEATKNWTISSEFIPLEKDTTKTGVRCISAEFKGFTHVRKLKDDIAGRQDKLQVIKGYFFF